MDWVVAREILQVIGLSALAVVLVIHTTINHRPGGPRRTHAAPRTRGAGQKRNA